MSRNCFRDRFRERAGQLLYNFSPVPNNSSRSLCESKRDPPSFLKWQIYSLSFSQVINNKVALHLIFDSFSFSYGDRAPRSVLARTFAFIWVLIGLVIISIFTATVTTSLTAISLSNEIKLYGSDVSHFQPFNPLNPRISIQILQTDLHTFP